MGTVTHLAAPAEWLSTNVSQAQPVDLAVVGKSTLAAVQHDARALLLQIVAL